MTKENKITNYTDIDRLLNSADFCNEVLIDVSGNWKNLSWLKLKLSESLERELTESEIKEVESFFNGHLDGLADDLFYEDQNDCCKYESKEEVLQTLKERLLN